MKYLWSTIILLFVSVILLVACTAEASPFVEAPPLVVQATATSVEVQQQVTPSPTSEDVILRESLSPATEKPSLRFSSQVELPPRHVIGFTFPDGEIALLVAAVERPRLTSDGLYEVGVVEFGAESSVVPSGIYTVVIDLENWAKEAIVRGKLIPHDEQDVIELTFSRVPQVLNSERRDDIEPAPIEVSISSDTVCFVVTDTENGDRHSRYCSMPDSPLSVRANFTEKYEALIGQMQESASILVENGVLEPNVVVLDKTISEMENPGYIEDCAQERESATCSADIAGAPVSTLWDDYYEARERDDERPYPITAGVIRVLRPIEVPQREPVEPGHYVLDYWFRADETFVGATLSGITDSDRRISDQQIPATSALFIDTVESDQITSQISAWRVGRWCCFWQRRCP